MNYIVRQLLLSFISLCILWAYYSNNVGKIIAGYFETIGVSKLWVHLIILPMALSILHLLSSGKKSEKHYWFIAITWLTAIPIIFIPIGDSFIAIISLISALISYVLSNSIFIYWRATPQQKATMREGLRKGLVQFFRTVGH